MPALANQRWERFAQELAKGKSATEAYGEAGYKPQQQNASRLMLTDVVQARVVELKERGAIKAEITLEKLQAMAERAYEAAFDLGQIAAAVSAVKELGVLSGYRVEKSERKNTHDARDLSEAELDAAIAAAVAREEAATGLQARSH
jgi:hypothetical protein